jgi:hypothetical protein
MRRLTMLNHSVKSGNELTPKIYMPDYFKLSTVIVSPSVLPSRVTT